MSHPVGMPPQERIQHERSRIYPEPWLSAFWSVLCTAHTSTAAVCGVSLKAQSPPKKKELRRNPTASKSTTLPQIFCAVSFTLNLQRIICVWFFYARLRLRQGICVGDLPRSAEAEIFAKRREKWRNLCKKIEKAKKLRGSV